MNFKKFKRTQKKDGRFSIISWRKKQPFLNEKTQNTKFSSHYIYHPAWAARILEKTQPELHTDISSTLHFCSIISAFIPTEFYDYRPPHLKLNNLKVDSTDLTSLPFKDNSIESLSCMHTVEHIGLGRYGDTINPTGDVIAMRELKRVLASNGNLLFVVPIGKPQIIFNAHRIYSYDQIIDNFSDLKLEEFALIPDDYKNAGMLNSPEKKLIEKQNHGCGCFWFRKPKNN